MASKKRKALKHGANAKEVMLWSERYEDYKRFAPDLIRNTPPTAARRNIWSKHFWTCVGVDKAWTAVGSSVSKNG